MQAPVSIQRDMQRWFGFLALAMTLWGAVWLWWACERNPEVNFLPRRGAAEWIAYPNPPVGAIQGKTRVPTAPEIVTVFRRTFHLDQALPSVSLAFSAFKSCTIVVNGQRVVSPPEVENWKAVRKVDVGPLLRAGDNLLQATVASQDAWPALWLTLEGQGLALRSDEGWQASCLGAVWMPARLASASPMLQRGNLLWGGENTLTSLGRCWGWLAGVAGTCVAAVLLRRRWGPRRIPGFRFNPAADMPRTVLGLIVLLWVFLLAHNLSLLPRSVGFDRDAHVEYIIYIQQHSGLPLADQGWEMHQPPLYYLIAAAVLNRFHLSAASFDGHSVLRLLGLMVGVAHITFVFGSLRLLFPRQVSMQIAGLVLAGFTSMHLYLAHYVTNECLSACLMSATVYLVLRVLRAGRSSAFSFAAVGLCLGLALLTKITALLLVPLIVAAVIFAALKTKPVRLGNLWLPLLTASTCVLACGWHYGRVWSHFGSPLAGDPSFRGWLDPGFRSATFFMRFGRTLIEPFFAGLYSFPDGVYSTLWADGFWGGAPAIIYRPPWNYDLMATGCLLALFPTALILLGLAVALLRTARRPNGPWCFLLAFAFALGFALLRQNVRDTSFAVVKAFYVLSGLVALCAFGALGWKFVTRKAARMRLPAGVAFAVWAISSYAALWIHERSADTQALLGRGLLKDGNYSGALVHLEDALRRDPGHKGAATFLFASLLEQGRLDEAERFASAKVLEYPQEPLFHLNLALALELQGQLAPALQHTARVIALAPDEPNARFRMAALLFKTEAYDQAVVGCREALRLRPVDPDLHALLASALAAQSARLHSPGLPLGENALAATALSPAEGQAQISDAIEHLRFVARITPDNPVALASLAWLLSTSAGPELRDGKQALALAEQACKLTQFTNSVTLLTLSAAYAATGQYALAVQIAEKRAQQFGNSEEAQVREQSQLMLQSFTSQRPYRDWGLPAGLGPF